MILAVDVGNTNVVLGYLDGTAVVGRSRIVTRRDGEAAPYAAELRRSLRENGLTAAQIEGAILSSVVPEADAALIAAIREALSCDCITVRAGMRTDMPICIEEPHTLGADIIAGCVGALADYGAPLAVVDMGTATTVVVVDADGNYRGGVILPGVKLALQALTAGTSLLPDSVIAVPGKCIATATEEAMRSGAVYGSAAMLDGLIDRMEAELGQKLTVVATGGLAGCIVPYCTRDIAYEPELLLKGLAVLYEKNKK